MDRNGNAQDFVFAVGLITLLVLAVLWGYNLNEDNDDPVNATKTTINGLGTLFQNNSLNNIPNATANIPNNAPINIQNTGE